MAKAVIVIITPEGSELLFGPKNHSKFGEGTLGGRGLGAIVAEHTREELLPTVLEPERERSSLFQYPLKEIIIIINTIIILGDINDQFLLTYVHILNQVITWISRTG